MSIPFMLASYFVIWWVVLFAVLPFGVHTQEEAGSVVPGTPASAPAHFRFGRVARITTLVSAVVFAIIVTGIRLRILDLETLVSYF